ncbi:MAG: hypothetical protein ACOCQB_01635 [Halanaerobiaceae bacterium]
MPFGYSDDIFRHPTVQYIPLKMYKVHQGKHQGNNDNVSFYIYSTEDTEQLNDNMGRIYENRYSIKIGRLAILTKNIEIDIIKYRGREVTLVGHKTPGFSHLFQITTEYFYKNNLTFILYNGETADRIALRHYRAD